MKTTKYFQFSKQRADRAEIEEKWILRTIESPICTKVQKDGRIQMWSRVAEFGGKYLRVITLEDRETVHNAFFDRNFKEGQKNES